MANRQDHLIVFILSTSLFITGVLAGISLSRMRMGEVETRINFFERDMNSLELAVLINDALNNETLSCNFLKDQLNATKEELKVLGEKAADYEDETKIKDAEYKDLKKQYNSFRAQYWLMLEKLKRHCNNNYTTILFFYRTLTPCTECRDEGVILSHIGLKDSNVYVVPVDADEDVLIVKTIKNAFNVNETPALIIDASKKLTGLISEDELLGIILKNQNTL